MSKLDVVMLITPKQYHKATAMRRAVREEVDDPLFLIFFIHLAFIRRYLRDCDGSFFFRMENVPKLFRLFPRRRGLPGTAIVTLPFLVLFLAFMLVVVVVVVVVAEGDDMVIFTFKGLLMVGIPVDWGAFTADSAGDGAAADSALKG